MIKSCKELFSGMDCTIIGDPNVEVTGISYNSNTVEPGDAFCCIVGQNVDGHIFAQQAIDKGASVLVVERKLYLADVSKITEVVVSDSRKAMAIISANFYNNPSHHFSLIGITGTNGKTTTTYLVDHLAKNLGLKTGLIGTVGIRINGVEYSSDHTTPESSDLQKIFSQMRDESCSIVSMEVSSHALDLDRVWDSKFAVTAFTNLTQDHLDYHLTFESYFDAKAKLFSKDYPAKRVINIDSKWGKQLLKKCVEQNDDILTIGFSKSAIIHPEHIEYYIDATSITLSVQDSVITFMYPLVGKFNVENIMSAFGIGIQLGWSYESIASALENAPAIPGRLQHVQTQHDGGISIYVDYAHTPDALEKALQAIKSISSNRCIVVFGCGGDRDATKRPLMGKAALLADLAIVTSDNPRSENPHNIIADIVEGMNIDQARYHIEPDRRSAIAYAIAQANLGDTILIAGKGHEDYQILKDETIHFNDIEVAAQELEKVYG